MDLCSRPKFRVQFMHVKCSLGTSMLAPSLKKVNPQSLIFFELQHFEPLQHERTLRKWEAGWQHGTLWCHLLKKGL